LKSILRSISKLFHLFYGQLFQVLEIFFVSNYSHPSYKDNNEKSYFNTYHKISKQVFDDLSLCKVLRLFYSNYKFNRFIDQQNSDRTLRSLHFMS
jgi:hypothetical protein